MRFLAGLALALALVGCGSEDSTPEKSGQAVCEAGKQEACGCPGGDQGVQVCKSDGSGWGTCDGCGAAGAGGSGGSGDIYPPGCEPDTSGGTVCTSGWKPCKSCTNPSSPEVNCDSSVGLGCCCSVK